MKSNVQSIDYGNLEKIPEGYRKIVLTISDTEKDQLESGIIIQDLRTWILSTGI